MSSVTNTTPQVLSAFSQVDFSQIAAAPRHLLVEDLGTWSHINIRGNADKAEFLEAVKSVLGVDLPIEANTFIQSSNTSTILWLGPNEWLLAAQDIDTAAMVEKLRQALGGQYSSVHDVSGGNAVLRIAGEKASDLLVKGCPMDLHPSVFSKGQCAQTIVAKTGVTLWKISDSGEYRLIVRRSFADYLGNWILDAAGEFA